MGSACSSDQGVASSSKPLPREKAYGELDSVLDEVIDEATWTSVSKTVRSSLFAQTGKRLQSLSLQPSPSVSCFVCFVDSSVMTWNQDLAVKLYPSLCVFPPGERITWTAVLALFSASSDFAAIDAKQTTEKVS